MKQSTDTVPALLTPGEAVLNRGAKQLLGDDMIHALNRHGLKLMQGGGIVGDYLDKPSIEINAGGPQASAVPQLPGDPSGAGIALPTDLNTTLNQRQIAELAQTQSFYDQLFGGQNPSANLAVGNLSDRPDGVPAYGGGFPGFGGGPSVASFAGPGFAAGTGIPGGGAFGTSFENLGFGPFGGGGHPNFMKEFQYGGIVPQSYNPGVQTDYSGLGSAISGLGGGLGSLLNYFANKPDQMTQNYAQAGSSSPVYGQSGYPSAIPAGGYGPPVRAGAGGLGNLTPQQIMQLIAIWRANQGGQ